MKKMMMALAALVAVGGLVIAILLWPAGDSGQQASGDGSSRGTTAPGPSAAPNATQDIRGQVVSGRVDQPAYVTLYARTAALKRDEQRLAQVELGPGGQIRLPVPTPPGPGTPLGRELAAGGVNVEISYASRQHHDSYFFVLELGQVDQGMRRWDPASLPQNLRLRPGRGWTWPDELGDSTAASPGPYSD